MTLVTASNLPAPQAIETVRIDSAKEMYEEINSRFKETDILVMSAAVSDYGVATTADSKMKKADILTS